MEHAETIIPSKIITTAFNQYRQSIFSEKKIVVFPKEIIFPFSNEQDLEKIYQKAENLWTENFNGQDFAMHMNVFVGSGNSQLKPYFKNIRKYGLILKSAYRFADPEKNLPQEYDDFIKVVGQFNEHNNTLLIYPIDTMINTALHLDIKPERHGTTSFTEAKKRVAWICQNITIRLSEENSVVSQKDNFHKFRKLTRHLMNLYQLMGYTTHNEKYTNTFLFLHQIVDDMGSQLETDTDVYFLEDKQKQNLIEFLHQLSDLTEK